MRIIELLSEAGTIGTTGSTTGSPGTVSPISNVPSDKPASATSSTPTETDPNLQKLAATLKQNKIIDNEADINNFISAYQAQSAGTTLNTNQQSSMSKLASAMLTNKSLDTTLDHQLKSISAVKPGTPSATQQAPGGM